MITKPKVDTSAIKPDAIEADIKSSVAEALEDIGARAVEMIRESLSAGSHSGVLYKIDGRLHRASAPDEAPVEYSGRLSRSLTYEVNAETSDLQVYSDTPYGNYLEYGTVNMAARPFIAPVMDELEPEIQAAMQNVVASNDQTDKTLQSKEKSK